MATTLKWFKRCCPLTKSTGIFCQEPVCEIMLKLIQAFSNCHGHRHKQIFLFVIPK